jgi:mismatch-specific thymine-DNA glycosylase
MYYDTERKVCASMLFAFGATRAQPACTIRLPGRTPDANRSKPGESATFMRTLPDYLRKGMKMILVGSNPGDRSARVGHYYAGRNNQFWPIMYESGVIPEPIGYEDDRRMLEFGIGMTDLVKRPTRAVDELERREFAEGRVLLAQKLEELRPRVIAFNGKMVYEKFAGRVCKLGLQKELLYGARVFVLPSTSGSNAGAALAVKKRYFKKLATLLKSLKD